MDLTRRGVPTTPELLEDPRRVLGGIAQQVPQDLANALSVCPHADRRGPVHAQRMGAQRRPGNGRRVGEQCRNRDRTGVDDEVVPLGCGGGLNITD
jgi:hypothetical protein